MKVLNGTLDTYKSDVIANNRSWEATINFQRVLPEYPEFSGFNWTLDTKHIKSFTISDYSTSNSNISMGSVVGGKLTFNLIDVFESVASELYKGIKIRVRLTLNNSTTLQSKVFVIDDVKIKKRRSGKVDISITAFSFPYTMTYIYAASATELTCLQVVSEIATKYGLAVNSSVSEAVAKIDGSTAYKFTMLAGFTDNQTLGYMAGCYGCFAYVNDAEEICFGWYKDVNDTIASDRIFENGVQVSEMTERQIVTIETGTQNKILKPTDSSTASGYAISFENPYITQTQVDAIYTQKIKGGKIKFKTGKIKYKGDPTNSPGSIIKLSGIGESDTSFYIMKRTLNYDGGLSETVECLGESEATIKYKSVSPTQQKIEQALSKYEDAIKNATDVITQTKGGIFELIPIDENDPSKGNKGYTITATESNNNNKIIANAGGIGFSTDGGTTIDAAAMYFKKDSTGKYRGHVNAECIEAGTISGDKIEANSIGAEHIKAGAISANQILVGDVTNLSIINPSGDEPYAGVVQPDHVSIVNNNGTPYFKFGGNTSNYYPLYLNRFSNQAVFQENDWYLCRAVVKATRSDLQLGCILRAKYADGTHQDLGYKYITNLPTSSHEPISISFKLNQGVINSTKKLSHVLLYLDIHPRTTDGNDVYGWVETRDITVYRMTNGVLIADGAVTANKIVAGSINTTHLDTANLTIGIGNVKNLEGKIADFNSITALENKVTVVKGSKIATGSIDAVSIKANTITTEKMSVGTGLELNQFYNHEFYDGIRGWYGYNGSLIPQGASQSWAYMQLKPNSSSNSAIMQKLWLVNGHRYSIVAQIYPLNWSRNTSDALITYFVGTGGAYNSQDLTSAFNYNGETVIKMVFDFKGETGFIDTGLGFRGIMNGSTPCTINIAWMSISDATGERTGFYCSRKEWLASGYKESNYLSGSVGSSTTADGYLKKKSLTIDSGGNLVTLGTIKSNSGEIGSMVYNRDRMDIKTHSYYKFGELPAFVSSRISFINPLNYKEYSAESGYGGINSVEGSRDWSAKIEVASDGGVQGLEGNEHTLITSSGVSVVSYSKKGVVNHASLTARGVELDGVNIHSRENIKKEILQKNSILNVFKNSKIYEYKMKYDTEKSKIKTGFIIERETPQEVLSDDGNAINLYSMASLNWKATQEILERLEALEEKAVNTNV